MSTAKSVKPATAFTIAAAEPAANGNGINNGFGGGRDCDSQQTAAAAAALSADEAAAELLLPDRLRRRLQAERKCRPTNEQLDQKLARAEQRRQKQCAKRAASAREAEARCRRVAEAMEALHARQPESRAQVMQRFMRLQSDLQGVLGRFNSEVERTNCALFAGAPLLAFGVSATSASSSASPRIVQVSPSMLPAHHQQQQQQPLGGQKRRGTAFVVAHPESAADAAASEMPARLKQRLAAYPKRRSRHELKAALEKKLADAQRRKERYEQRRAESIKETEDRCRRISETMEEISLSESDSASTGQDQGQQQQQQHHSHPASTEATAATSAESPAPSSYYRRVAKLQVDLDCLFTKFNREFVTVRGRPIDLLESLLAAGYGGGSQHHQQLQLLQHRRHHHHQRGLVSVVSSSSVACQTEPQCCLGCGGNPCVPQPPPPPDGEGH